MDARPSSAGQPAWTTIVVGLVSIVFGLAALLWPGITLEVLSILFGAFVLIWGATELIAAYAASRNGRVWWTHAFLGLIGVVAGIVVFAYPGLTAFALLAIIAYWAVVLGVFQILLSFGTSNFVWVVTGLIALLFGFVLLANRDVGALAAVPLIGLFAIIEGIVLLAGAVRPTEARPHP